MRDSIQKAILAARAADDKKGEEIAVIDLDGVCTFTDAFVIVTGQSNLQLRALAEGIRESLAASGSNRPTIDGERQASWMAMDYGDVVVHLMTPDIRGYYRLEDLWGDGQAIDWRQPADTA